MPGVCQVKEGDLRCLPAIPLLLRATIFCQWRQHQRDTLAAAAMGMNMNTNMGQDGQDGRPPASDAYNPDLVLPRLGMWLTLKRIRFAHGKQWKWEFLRTGNFIVNRDCVASDNAMLHVQDMNGFVVERDWDDWNRTVRHCDTTLPRALTEVGPATWWRAARDPIACVRSNSLKDLKEFKILKALLPAHCGSWCVMHPKVSTDPTLDNGWVLIKDKDSQCWWYTDSMSKDTQCKEWAGTAELYSRPFEWSTSNFKPYKPRNQMALEFEYYPAQRPEVKHTTTLPVVTPQKANQKPSSPNVCDEIIPGVCGPTIIIGGAMKCGTNTLANLLAKHPRVKLKTCQFPVWARGLERLLYCNDTFAQGRVENGEVVRVWETHYFT